MTGPYRQQHVDGRQLQPDPRARRRVHFAGLTTAALGVGIGATAPMLGPLAAVLGGGMALLGIALFREAPKNPMKALCPACSAEIGEIDPSGEAVQCPACGEYARSESAMLLPVRDDFVARLPTFAIPVPGGERFDLPPICAECGAPRATHAVTLEVPVPTIPMGSSAWHRLVHVPHCPDHAAGAASEFGAIRVRAHALWLAAVRRG